VGTKTRGARAEPSRPEGRAEQENAPALGVVGNKRQKRQRTGERDRRRKNRRPPIRTRYRLFARLEDNSAGPTEQTGLNLSLVTLLETQLCFEACLPVTADRFHVLLNPLFRVLCNYPSRYLFAIGLVESYLALDGVYHPS